MERNREREGGRVRNGGRESCGERGMNRVGGRQRKGERGRAKEGETQRKGEREIQLCLVRDISASN